MATIKEYATWPSIRLALQQEYSTYAVMIDYDPKDNEMLVRFYPNHDRDARPIIIPDGRYDFPSDAFFAKCRLVL